MRYFSFFSGIGGFEKGIEQAYDNRYNIRHRNTNLQKDMSDSSERTNRVTCVGYSEIDKYACQVYEKHYPEHKNYGDISTINAKEIPEHDLLVGGFPCQSFSIVGQRGGFDDTRGTLFFEVARIAAEKRPSYLLLENVKGLLSHDRGRTFGTILTALDEIGYDAQWEVLNSKNFGVPQNRERVFIVGHSRNKPRPQVFPLGGADAEDTQSKQEQPVNDRVYGAGGVSTTLNTMQGGRRQPFVRVKEATKKGYAEAHPGQSINLYVPNSKTRRGRVSDTAQTLDTGMHQHTLTEDAKIRRLTPLECERLQGFPDNWTSGISDSQRYKCLGNAVTVNVVEAVVEKLLQ